MPSSSWPPEETEKLRQLLADNLDADWFTIADLLGTGRTPGACRKQASRVMMPFRYARRRSDSPVVEVKQPALFTATPSGRTEVERMFGSLLAAERVRGRRDVIEAVRGLLLKLTTED